MSSDDYFDRMHPPTPSAPAGTPMASIIFWTLITVLIRNVTRRAAAVFTAMAPTTPPALAALGLRWPCSAADVRHAFRRRALRVHPDHGGDAESFRRLVEVYEQALKVVGTG